VLLAIIVLEEFSSAAGETASNRFSITAMLSPFPTSLTKEDYNSGIKCKIQITLY